MPLEADYLAALERLGRVCEDYRRETGDTAFLVGGAAVAIWTGGVFHSADFDLIAAAEERFRACLLRHGFVPEARAGRLLVGYHHPELPQFGWQSCGHRSVGGLWCPDGDWTHIEVGHR